MGAHLDLCCHVCGDQGVIEAIATCSHCKDSHEHVYCMRVCLREVPEDWCCERCEDKNKNMSRDYAQPTHKTTIDREKKIPAAKVKPLTPEEVIKLSSGAKNSPVKNFARSNTMTYIRSKVESSPEKSPVKTKSLSSFNVRANPSIVNLKQMNPPRQGTAHINATSRQPQSLKEPRESFASEPVARKVSFHPSVKEHKQENFLQKQAMVAPKDTVTTKMSAPKDTASMKMAAPKDSDSTKMAAPKDTASTKMAAPKDRDSTKMAAPKDTASTKMAAPKDIDFTKMAASMVEKNTIITVPVGESSTKDNQLDLKSGGPASPDTVLTTTNTSAFTKRVLSGGVNHCLFDPVPHHVWMGRFRVTNNASFGEDQIQAHHPTRVHKTVYEISKKMPAVLNFELVDRKGIWVNMFADDYIPDQKDIALYFKPSNGLRSSNYISLLEHLQAKDLGLRMVMDRAVLMVFTSKALRDDCQKWEGSHFLWGVFRSTKLVVKAAAGPSDLYAADDDGVDMEIDMVGGLDVGQTEIAVPRTCLLLPPPPVLKPEPFVAVPPGFNSSHKLSPRIPKDKNGGGGASVGGGKGVKVEPPD